MKSLLLRCLPIVILLFGFSDAFAQKKAIYIQSSQAPVYAKPSASAQNQSEVLMTMKKGQSINAVGATRSGWVKIKIELEPGFSFDGWIYKSHLSIGGPSQSAPSQPKSQTQTFVRQAPRSAPTAPPKNELDQFFEEPNAKKQKVKKQKPPKVAKEKSSSAGTDDDEEKLVLAAYPMFTIHNYTFSSSTQPISYTLSGVGAGISASYKALRLMNDRLDLFAQGGFSYILFNAQAALNDTNGSNFLNLDAKNKAMQLEFKARGEYGISQKNEHTKLIGTLGVQHLQFKADDVQDNQQNSIGLFVGQKTTSVFAGVGGKTKPMDKLTLTGEANVMLLNLVKESPDGSSGSDPKGGIGFAPLIHAQYALFGNHHIGFKYQFFYQQTKFSGTSSQRINATLANAKVRTMYHFVGLGYEFHF
ncbi:MAG: SH3 domain-containing protein [Bdellovibrionota bacterium]